MIDNCMQTLYTLRYRKSGYFARRPLFLNKPYLGITIMSQITANAIALSNDRQIFIHADELTEGDIIKHFTGDTWQVISEPEYTRQGITFKVMWLDIATPNTQFVTFAPAWRFELINIGNILERVEVA